MKNKIFNFQFYEDWDYPDIITNLFLLILISISFNYSLFQGAQFILGVGGLIFSRIRKDPHFWFLIFLVQVIYLIIHWSIIDDHHFLMTSFSLSLGLSLYSKENQRFILENSLSYLVSISMLLSVFFKLLNYPEYGSGYFLSFMEIADSRFHWIVKLLGEDPVILQNELIQFLKGISIYPPQFKTLIFSFSQSFVTTNKMLELIILAFEAFIGMIFLFPKLRKLKVITLIAFIFIIYTAVPIIGFSLTYGVIALSLSVGALSSRYTAIISFSMLYSFINMIITMKKLAIVEYLLG
jgi:hypothetical protein